MLSRCPASGTPFPKIKIILNNAIDSVFLNCELEGKKEKHNVTLVFQLILGYYFCHNEETKAQRDKNTFFFNERETLNKVYKTTMTLSATSADRQLHIENNPQNQNGKWQPK